MKGSWSWADLLPGLLFARALASYRRLFSIGDVSNSSGIPRCLGVPKLAPAGTHLAFDHEWELRRSVKQMHSINYQSGRTSFSGNKSKKKGQNFAIGAL